MAETSFDDSGSDRPDVTIKSGRQFSTVWIIPIVAVLIGGWLAFTTISGKGPTIEISFKTAEGLEAGKTKIKFRDFDVGTVTEIRLKSDRSGVIASADIVKDAEDLMVEGTKFWVVRPRLDAKGISGLGTIVSGAFIEIDPADEGEAVKSFVGLEVPPVVKLDAAGKKFVLTTQNLGSYGVGSPVFNRGIEVGEVLGTELADDNVGIDVHIFVIAPHDKLIRGNTRFWNVSGFNVSLDANGMQVRTQSLTALLIGGIAFETPSVLTAVAERKSGDRFPLFDTKEAIKDATFVRKISFISYFRDSIRGLNVGAPVEFKGIKIGTVKDLKVEFNAENADFRIPVLLEIEPERLTEIGGRATKEAQNLTPLIERGLRAQLKTGNFVTGQLFVDLNFHPGSEIVLVNADDRFPEIPTIPSTLDEITRSVTGLVEKIQNLPLAKISRKLEDAVTRADRLIASTEKLVNSADKVVSSTDIEKVVQNLNITLESLNSLTAKFDRATVPQIAKVLTEAAATLTTARDSISEKSSLRFNAESMLAELATAARSIRNLAEFLERNPNALIAGKKAN